MSSARSLWRGSSSVSVEIPTCRAAGGYHGRKVIWNAFGIGGPPFFVSGGAVVHFTAVRPADQQVMAAGLFSCAAGYAKINRVAVLTNGTTAASTLNCKPAPMPPAKVETAKAALR